MLRAPYLHLMCRANLLWLQYLLPTMPGMQRVYVKIYRSWVTAVIPWRIIYDR